MHVFGNETWENCYAFFFFFFSQLLALKQISLKSCSDFIFPAIDFWMDAYPDSEY